MTKSEPVSIFPSKARGFRHGRSSQNSINRPIHSPDYSTHDAYKSNPTTNARTVNAPPEDIWPWLVQWGKDRGGWYLPAKVEKILPEKFRSTPTIVPKFQTLKVGDSVPDYGLGPGSKKDSAGEGGHNIEVALIESDRALVYKGERAGVNFTWALLLETPGGAAVGASSADSTASATETVLHLRFRGKSNQTGWKAKVAVQVAKVSDAVMASAIFPGIADRVEPKPEKAKKVKDVA